MIEFTASIKVMQAHDKLEEAELTEQRVSLHYTDYAEIENLGEQKQKKTEREWERMS